MAGRFRLRVNFGTRLVIVTLMISFSLIIAVSASLLISRTQQTRGAALSDADNRAKVLRALLQHVTGPQAAYAANNLAGLSVVNSVLTSADAGTATLADASKISAAAVTLPNEYIVVFLGDGRKFYESSPANTVQVTSTLTTVAQAMGGKSSQGVEVLRDGTIVDDFAVPVFSNDAAKNVLGAVVYAVPLDHQLANFHDAVGYPTVMIPAAGPNAGKIIRVPGDAEKVAPDQIALEPALLADALKRDSLSANGIYADNKKSEVAGSVVGLGDPNAAADPSHPGAHVAAYVGVEAPISIFVGNQASDERQVLGIALTAAVLVALAVTLFVNRFVRKPVAQLIDGVARIAGGDYSSDVKVDSRDELGLLADRVNVMRLKIASYIRHVDGSVTRLGEVSHALTTTTAGVTALASAVSNAAEAIAGEGTHAYVVQKDGDSLQIRGTVHPGVVLDKELETHILEKREQVVRIDEHGRNTYAMPMFFQGEVTGALVVSAPHELTDTDTATLEALTNNAAVALENTRLFEQEKATVAKLRELDAAKSDFLSTAQHELRTPVHAIMGQLDLIKVAWPSWDDSTKLQTIDDIERSTQMLGELLESIIDFSLLNTEALKLRWSRVTVASAVNDAVNEVSRHYPGGIPIPIDLQVSDDVLVSADPGRLKQVLRLLLDNAVKFSPPPKGSVTVSAHDEGELCVIEIKDTGVGIEETALRRIFERFYQADNTQTRAFGGLGMGLALASALCSAHGATVRAESAAGEGSRFIVEWPLAVPAGEDVRSGDAFHLSKL